MLDAPSDVFSFMINPSDPHLVCGGCANGQVALWDLGRSYYELRARTQDRRKKSSMDAKSNRPSFLEKLKDSAEMFACPLIPTVGLSNLDQSHKKVVTSTAWLPPHVEVSIKKLKCFKIKLLKLIQSPFTAWKKWHHVRELIRRS